MGTVGHTFFGGGRKGVHHTLGRPPTEPIRQKAILPIKVCPICKQIIGRGLSHPQPCKPSDSAKNVMLGVLKSPSKQEHVASTVIRRKSIEAKATGASTMTFATGGRPLTIDVPQRHKLLKALYPDGNVPTEEVQRMMNAAHISLKQTQIIEKFHRVWVGRDLYEPYVMKKLSLADKALLPFFTTMIVPMDPKSSKEKKEIGKSDRVLFYCHNLGALVAYIIKERGWENATQFFIKTGTDTGEGSLKTCMTVEKVDIDSPITSPVKKKFSYSTGALPKQFKPSGQHGCMIIAHVEKADESYDNLKIMAEALDCYKGLMEPGWVHIEVDDLKAANTSFGIGASGSECPDVFCELPKQFFGDPDYLFEGGELRTMGSIRTNANNYDEKKKNWELRNLKTKCRSHTFASCENQPLRKHEADSVLVIFILAIMTLHLKLG